MTTRPKYWLHISSTNQATSQVNTAVSPQTARNFGLARQRYNRRSSLKERGRVKTLATSDLGCLRPRRTRRNGRRGQGSGGARPRSGRRALRLAPWFDEQVGGRRQCSGRFLRVRRGLMVLSSG